MTARGRLAREPDVGWRVPVARRTVDPRRNERRQLELGRRRVLDGSGLPRGDHHERRKLELRDLELRFRGNRRLRLRLLFRGGGRCRRGPGRVHRLERDLDPGRRTVVDLRWGRSRRRGLLRFGDADWLRLDIVLRGQGARCRLPFRLEDDRHCFGFGLDLCRGGGRALRTAVEHRVDAAFEVLQHLGELARAPIVGVAQRRCRKDRGGKRLDLVAGRWLEATLAHRPGDLLDALGSGEGVGCGRRGRRRSLSARRLGTDLGDLGARHRDRLGHFQELHAEILVGLLAAVAADHPLDALDGVEHERGIGISVAPRKFLEEPAAARALHHGRADGVVIARRRRRERNRG